jgi:1-acyl-sn-glycerol-3-phosphate acyltransferase
MTDKPHPSGAHVSAVRVTLLSVGFLAVTLPLMPLQWVFLKTSPRLARWFPHWYHRFICRMMGIRVSVTGAVVTDRPVLLVSNHVSWLDITVLSAVAPVSFVAKKDMSTWPIAGQLAYLQRCVFVDRDRRLTVAETASQMAQRLKSVSALVLFPEGTTSDGNRVLPFRSSLFAVFKPETGEGAAPVDGEPWVQTMTLVYTRRNGLPLTWAERRDLGYYGDIGMKESVWTTLGGGPLEARVIVGPARPMSEFKDRKALARHAEAEVRAAFLSISR